MKLKYWSNRLRLRGLLVATLALAASGDCDTSAITIASYENRPLAPFSSASVRGRTWGL